MGATTTILRVRLGDEEFIADVEAAALHTLSLLTELLPIATPALHARWSGEALWTPLQWAAQPLSENCTFYPQPGQILLFPGGISEPELLIPYGACRFASKAGALAGNHVATIRGRRAVLEAAGRSVLHHGPVNLVLEAASQ